MPHDWPIENYRDPTNIPHHGDHCPDINGNQSDREYYAALRRKKHMTDPWYHNKQQPTWDESDEPTAEETQEAFNQREELLNQRHTIPEVPHPTNDKLFKLTGEDIMKNLVSDRQASLLHKRINKRKQEIAELKESQDVKFNQINNLVALIGNMFKLLSDEADKIIVDELSKMAEKARELGKGEKIDDYVNVDNEDKDKTE